MNALPDPRLLGFFILVAEELHFGRAAHRAGIAQPALSQQIRKLERAVGFPLFDRTSRRVALTPSGEAFLRTAHGVLTGLRDGIETGRLIAAGDLGQLAVGYSVPAMLTVLPRIVRRFRAEHPRVHLVLREMSSAPQLEALATGSLDVAFVGDPPHDAQGSRARMLWPDRVMLAVHSDHPIAHRRRIGPSARRMLAADPLVLFPRDQAPALFDRTLALWQTFGRTPEVSQHAQSWHTILTLVGAGLGVSIVPGCVRRLRVPSVRLVEIHPRSMEAGVAMCVRDGHMTAALRALCTVAGEVSWP